MQEVFLQKDLLVNELNFKKKFVRVLKTGLSTILNQMHF